MIERTAPIGAATTHILCCSCGIYFSAAASSENDQGSMNLASKTAPLASTRPSSVAAIQREPGVPDMRLHIRDHLTCISLVPASVQFLGNRPKLYNEVAREVLRLDLAAFLPPQSQEGGFLIAHDNPSIRASDKEASYCWNRDSAIRLSPINNLSACFQYKND